MSFASLESIVDRAQSAWRPPPQLSLSEWADRYFVLSSETAAEPGRWHTLPYQREIMDSITDRNVTQVVLMKSARIGYTLILSAAMGYYMHQDPSSMLVVQPTVDDAKSFSKETVTPMLRDVPVLSRLVLRDVEDKNPKDRSNTLTHKAFAGGILSLTGANSGTGFRRISRRVVMFDEVDAYPPAVGDEGDQIELGKKRSEAFHNRKIIAGSTPLVAGSSRIEHMFLEGDQRRYFVPCPHCSTMDFFAFNKDSKGGHVMRWPNGRPEEAYFECRACGCSIEHKDKRWMVERGEWRPTNPSGAYRSYHAWSALSYSPNATWADIARRFLEAKKGGAETLRTFVNVELGETWKEQGEAADFERLYDRREDYPVGTCPIDPVCITGGVDVQRDRLVVEIVAWAANKESWSVDAVELRGDTALESTWHQLDEVLNREIETPSGPQRIRMLAVDSGYQTQTVYDWVRRHPGNTIACKGSASATALFSPPRKVDVTAGGKTSRLGARVWITSPDVGKMELMGWLGLRRDEDGNAPPGFCHFPGHHMEFFKQLCGERLVTVTNKRTRRTTREWHVVPGRENHFLDARILARVAAGVLGIDRQRPTPAASVAPKPPVTQPPKPSSETPIVTPRAEAKKDQFWSQRPARSGWFSKRR